MLSMYFFKVRMTLKRHFVFNTAQSFDYLIRLFAELTASILLKFNAYLCSFILSNVYLHMVFVLKSIKICNRTILLYRKSFNFMLISAF